MRAPDTRRWTERASPERRRCVLLVVGELCSPSTRASNGRRVSRCQVFTTPNPCLTTQVLSALCLLERDGWVDAEASRQFILCCQDEHDGGISDKPGDEVDVFHTFFGIAVSNEP